MYLSMTKELSTGFLFDLDFDFDVIVLLVLVRFLCSFPFHLFSMTGMC